jgi:signal peptidase II
MATAVAAAVVAVDQVAKTWALHLPFAMVADGVRVQGRHVIGSLYFELTFNSGAAFGLGSGVTPIVETVVVVLVCVLLFVGRRTSLRSGRTAAIGLGLIVGGAVGNLSDRVFRDHGGAVIDFINVAQVGDHEYWPVFNLADACIVVGALLLALTYARTASRVPAGPVPRRPSDV